MTLDRRFFLQFLALSAFILGSSIALAQPKDPPAITSLAELQERLSNHISHPRFDAAMWGIKVVSLASGKTLFEQNPQKLFSPASNSKMFTVALALERLGLDYRIRTSLYSKAEPTPQGVLKGDLIVFGRGDPTITARLHGNDLAAALDPLVRALTNAGVKRIAGDVIADESYFRGPPFGSGWTWDDSQYYYGAEISALTINDNTLKVSVKPGPKVGAPCQLSLSTAADLVTFSNRSSTVEKGARRSINFYRPINENVVYVSGQIPLDDPGASEDLTIHDPANFFLTLFKQALGRHEIKVNGKFRTVNWLDREANPLDCEQMVELGFVESLPLREITREVMKPSQNLYTDLLLAHVGEKYRDRDSRHTSEDLGVRELDKFLGEAGIKRGEVLFEEGSGLSRNNLTTPNATIALLQYMSQRPSAEAYDESFPIAGVDGTLRNRMKGTSAAGNVRAKTGTLRWANALSGHVTTGGGERLVFSIMLNRYYNDSDRPARPEIDAIAVMLADFKGHSGKP